MNIDFSKEPWSKLAVKTIKEQLIDKKWELETRLETVKRLYSKALTDFSRDRSSKRFDYLMHKLKAINRRIVLLEEAKCEL